MPGDSASRAPAALLLGLLVLAALIAGCDRPQADTAKGKGPAAAPLPAVVTVSKPRIEDIVEWDEYTGRFEAVEQVDIRARVSGYLMLVGFKDGQIVKKGDLLYVIDPRPFERALEQAQAELAQAKTKAENAMLDVERGKPLVERRVMSEKVFDDRANVLREAQSAIKVAEAKVATAELDLSFTRIVAPISGRISRSMQTAGNWISGRRNGVVDAADHHRQPGPDLRLLRHQREQSHQVPAPRRAAGEKEGAAIPGTPVEVAMPDERRFIYKGVLDFIDNRLDQGTATLRARAVIDNDARAFSARHVRAGPHGRLGRAMPPC